MADSRGDRGERHLCASVETAHAAIVKRITVSLDQGSPRAPSPTSSPVPKSLPRSVVTRGAPDEPEPGWTSRPGPDPRSTGLHIGLPEFGQMLARTGDPQVALQRAVQAVVEGVPGADAGLVFLFEADRRKLAVMAAHGYGRDMLRIVACVDQGGAPGVVFRTHQPQVWSSSSAIGSLIHSLEPPGQRLLYNARQGLPPATSLLCTPCVARGRLVGFVQLERHRDARPFVLSELELAQAFANQLALLLNEVQLLREFRQREAAWADLLCRVLERQASASRRLTAEWDEAANLALATVDDWLARRGEVALPLAADGEPCPDAGPEPLANLRQELSDRIRIEAPTSRAQPPQCSGAVTAGGVRTAAGRLPPAIGAPTGRLTRRETEVARLIAEGRTNGEIAERLQISLRTVQTHRAHILDKLGVHERTGVVRYAIREGLILP